jgi:hypothetical protein
MTAATLLPGRALENFVANLSGITTHGTSYAARAPKFVWSWPSSLPYSKRLSVSSRIPIQRYKCYLALIVNSITIYIHIRHKEIGSPLLIILGQ